MKPHGGAPARLARKSQKILKKMTNRQPPRTRSRVYPIITYTVKNLRPFLGTN
jgi:hypothetical protein